MRKKIIVLTAVGLIAIIAAAMLLAQMFQPRTFTVKVQINCYVWHYRNGALLSFSHHPMTLVNNGKDWIEQQMFNPNASQKALWIGVSNSSDAVDTSWTIIPDEITTSGLTRKQGTYTSTGIGTANVTVTFTVTGTASTKLYGLYYGAYSTDPNTLIAAEQQGVSNQKNLQNGDTLQVTVQWSVN